MISVKEIDSYKDYGRILSFSNNIIEVGVTIDVGPRIIYFKYVDGQNILCDKRKDFGVMTDKRFTDFYGENTHWENLGGHRVWITPESYPETYYPDQHPVQYALTDFGAIFTPPAEQENGVQKFIEIRLDPDDADMQVIMSCKNIEKTEKEFSIWSLSVCDGGGTLIIPMNNDDTGLLHNRTIAVWPYTDMTDDRIWLGKKYTTVRQDKISPSPIKLGFDLKRERVFYVLGDDVFSKHFSTNHQIDRYPDGGCSMETYTNELFIEVESLSKIHRVSPGETVSYTESWSLTKKPCEIDFKSDKSIDNLLSKL
ncbi:MAG: hypothetical protein IKI29_06335 [Clostridia bacterium]|nr:hypothetical protein [Clostridia bacterium]